MIEREGVICIDRTSEVDETVVDSFSGEEKRKASAVRYVVLCIRYMFNIYKKLHLPLTGHETGLGPWRAVIS